MRRALAALVVVLSTCGWFVPVAATPGAVRALNVSGTGAGMYPTFAAANGRYAVTTTDATGGTIQLTATTTDPDGVVLVDGRRTSGPVTTVSGLTPGDEVSVIFDDLAGRTSYALVFLPAGFPAMAATWAVGVQPADLQPGYLGVGLTTFAGGPSFEGLLDRNGVPAWVSVGTGNDLKRQPDGELTVSRPTTAPGHTGYDLVSLDEQFVETARRHVVGSLVDTDTHDSERLPDGSTILIGYEPRGACGTGHLDATIQKQDPDGNAVFTWSSEGLESESLNPLPWPQTGDCQRIDYAHINSVQEIPDGSHDLLVSFRHFSSVYRISTDPSNTADHHIVWRLGGRHSDFTFPGGDGGPCAQHNATWLGANHVLLYDNGSVALGSSLAGCVDPAQRDGPGISRTQTRVTEYALDVDAGTADVVHSYEPAGVFTFFAGSTSRLDNGDTLVGWASDRRTLATELGPDMASPLWSLAVPGNTQNVGYASYRVSLVPYTDAIPPTIQAAGTDNATYVIGDDVTVPAPTCADRGGSNLQTCSLTGVSAGHLDTSTPGMRTWSAQATDGAGNTTTVVRHYTVRSGRQPDGLIRKSGSTTWKGANVYGPATSQTVLQDARRRETVTSYWRVQNDGERADTFALSGSAGNGRFRVRYFAGGSDVTSAVVAGTYRTATLAPGALTAIRVEVTPTRRAPIDARRTVTLTAVSLASSASTDAVATRVTVKR